VTCGHPSFAFAPAFRAEPGIPLSALHLAGIGYARARRRVIAVVFLVPFAGHSTNMVDAWARANFDVSPVLFFTRFHSDCVVAYMVRFIGRSAAPSTPAPRHQAPTSMPAARHPWPHLGPHAIEVHLPALAFPACWTLC